MARKNEAKQEESVDEQINDVEAKPQQERADVHTASFDDAMDEVNRRLSEDDSPSKGIKILSPDDLIEHEGFKTSDGDENKKLRCGETLIVTKKTSGIGNSQLQRCIAVGLLDESTGQRHDCLVPLYRVNETIMFQDKPELMCVDEKGEVQKDDSGRPMTLPMLFGNVAFGMYWMDSISTISFDDVQDALVYSVRPEIDPDSEQAKDMPKEELEQMNALARDLRAQHLNHVFAVMQFLNQASRSEQIRLELLGVSLRALSSM